MTLYAHWVKVWYMAIQNSSLYHLFQRRFMTNAWSQSSNLRCSVVTITCHNYFAEIYKCHLNLSKNIYRVWNLFSWNIHAITCTEEVAVKDPYIGQIKPWTHHIFPLRNLVYDKTWKNSWKNGRPYVREFVYVLITSWSLVLFSGHSSH